MRRATPIARLMWALVCACLCAGVALRILNRATPTADNRPPVVVEGVFLVLFLAFATVGLLIATRQPRNAIGWIFCALGLAGSVAVAGEEYALHALVTAPESLPGGGVAAWLAGFLGGPFVLALLVLLLLLFPNGRPLSPRWRPLVGLMSLAIGLIFLGSFDPGPIDELTLVSVRNALGVERAGALLNVVGWIGYWLIPPTALASAVAVVFRFRRARGDERLQLKWFMWSGSMLGSVVLISPLIFAAGERLPDLLWPALVGVAVLTIPIATGIALLKYRLYDVDVVINRTLVYGLLTASLAATYVGLVLLLQLAFGPLTKDNALAVAGSTLAVAALFRPARSKIQAAVDRRFYRRRYDAARTLERFSARLRDEIDLDALGAELRAVVSDAMQPAHVSLWLREAAP